VHFTRAACRRIYRFAGGIPRLINIACDRALLCAFGVEKPQGHPPDRGRGSG